MSIKCGEGAGMIPTPSPTDRVSSLHEAAGESLLEALTGEVAGSLDELVDVAEQIAEDAEGAVLADDAAERTEIEVPVVLLEVRGPDRSGADAWGVTAIRRSRGGLCESASEEPEDHAAASETSRLPSTVSKLSPASEPAKPVTPSRMFLMPPMSELIALKSGMCISLYCFAPVPGAASSPYFRDRGQNSLSESRVNCDPRLAPGSR